MTPSTATAAVSARAMRLTRVFDNDREISVVVSGHADIDDMLDVFRGFLVQIGYSPETAMQLVLAERDEHHSAQPHTEA